MIHMNNERAVEIVRYWNEYVAGDVDEFPYKQSELNVARAYLRSNESTHSKGRERNPVEPTDK